MLWTWLHQLRFLSMLMHCREFLISVATSQLGVDVAQIKTGQNTEGNTFFAVYHPVLYLWGAQRIILQ